MGRKIRRDTNKKVTSTGYQLTQGDLEVQGRLLGPAVDQINAAVAKVSAISTTPVRLAAPVLEGGMRCMNIRWSRQYNLSNFSHYELQVSDDDEKWYSLLLDGTGWKGNLNEDTDVKTESFVHANIPLREDAGDLVGVALYYRVRQATFSETASEWSESAHATTKGVEDLVLTDSNHRYIEISSRKGIYADDRQGHVIHDIPNAPIFGNMSFAGHLIFMENTGWIANINMDYTDAAVALATVNSTVSNTDVTAWIPAGLTNARGILASFIYSFTIAATKVLAATQFTGITCFSTVYNDAQNNYATYDLTKAMVAGVSLSRYGSGICPVPLITYEGKQYVTWNAKIGIDTMGNANANYNFTTRLSILGVFA